MENKNVGRVIGKGVYDEKLLAWEFRDNELKFDRLSQYLGFNF